MGFLQYSNMLIGLKQSKIISVGQTFNPVATKWEDWFWAPSEELLLKGSHNQMKFALTLTIILLP